MEQNEQHPPVSRGERERFLAFTGRRETVDREIRNRRRTVEAARDAGLEITEEELQEAADRFRLENGLEQVGETERWLKDRNVTMEDLESFLEEELLISKWKDHLLAGADREELLEEEDIRDELVEQVFRDWLVETVEETEIRSG